MSGRYTAGVTSTRPFLALLGGVLALLALAVLLGTLMPPATLTQTVAVDPANLSLPSNAADAPRFPQDLSVQMNVPVRVTLGQMAVATVEVRPMPVSPTIAGTPQDATSTFRPVAVARLSSTLAEVLPDGDEGQSLLSGRPIRFSWTLRPSDSGQGELNLVVRLRFYPQSGGSPIENVLVARSMAMTAVPVLGLPSGTARIIAAVVLVLGVAVILYAARSWGRLGRA